MYMSKKDVPETGDTVTITYDGKELVGILMPRIAALADDVIVIKLDNGYNIGIRKDRISSLQVREKYQPKQQKKATGDKGSLDVPLPRISLLSFGGTISSRIDYRTGGVHADYTAEDFIAMAPDIGKKATITAHSVMNIMSEDAESIHWKAIAAAIHQEIVKDDVDGVVITVGTDTLHYITAALSFFLKDLTKPVVVTASQRSIDRGSSDAFMNLSCAITAACSDIAEVMSCMHGTINDDYCLLIRGTKVRKMHTSRRDAFRPINEKALAKVFHDGKLEIINKQYTTRGTHTTCILDNTFEPNIALILAYPGQQKDIVDFYLKKGCKGIVVAATALGHVQTNTEQSMIPSFVRAIKAGVPVIIASQTLYGRTHPHVYTNLRKLSLEVGCIFAEDMMPEVAYVKLGYILSKAHTLDEISKLMVQNLRGEINSRHLSDEFLI